MEKNESIRTGNESIKISKNEKGQKGRSLFRMFLNYCFCIVLIFLVLIFSKQSNIYSLDNINPVKSNISKSDISKLSINQNDTDFAGKNDALLEQNYTKKVFQYINTSNAIVREKPSHDAKIKHFCKCKGYPVEIIASNGIWRAIRDVYGNTGWVHVSALTNKKHVLTYSDCIDINSSEKATNNGLGNSEFGNNGLGNGKVPNDKVGNNELRNSKVANDKTRDDRIVSNKTGDDGIGNNKVGSNRVKSDKIEGDRIAGSNKIGNDRVIRGGCANKVIFAFRLNNSKSKILFKVESGVVGVLERCLGNYCKVRFENKESGWIDKVYLWGL